MYNYRGSAPCTRKILIFTVGQITRRSVVIDKERQKLSILKSVIKSEKVTEKQ